MDDKILSLMLEYFQADIFHSNLREETKEYIIEKFSLFEKEKFTNEDVIKALQGTKLRKLKYHLSVKYNENNRAFPIKLRELKAELQQEACSQNMSLHGYIKKLLKQRRKPS